MHFRIAPPVSAVILTSSLHGLSDLRHSPCELRPYLFALVPSGIVTTPLFLVASAVHFSDDVGMGASAVLHATLVALAAMGRSQVAWTLLAAYMVTVHVPLHLQRATRATRRLLYRCAFALPFLLPCSHDAFVVTEWMQRVVVAHILVSRRGGISRRRTMQVASHTPAQRVTGEDLIAVSHEHGIER